METLIDTKFISVNDSTESEYLRDDCSGALAMLFPTYEISCCTCSCSCCC